MRYLPHTPEDIAAMLRAIGVEQIEDLFGLLPDDCRRKGDLELPAPLTEWELNDWMERLAGTIATPPDYRIFLGAGSYRHHIPTSITHLLSRSEFVTAYTPYQPEMSQGTLQAIYEYQTLSARLLGLEVSNASLYDGASALAEAVLMALRITKRKSVAVSTLVHPHYRSVVQTYLRPSECETRSLPYLPNGRTDLAPLDDMQDLAAVVIQSPNFLGCIEALQEAGDRTHGQDALLIASFTEPLAYGILKNPGSQGADVACGEGQSLGIPPSYGGPGLGMFAGRMKHLRNMPGRLVGETVDMEGKRGYVLTLATREQHIRRERATSNICTNNSLCALAAAMYLASLGGSGIRELAQLNHDKAEYLKRRLKEAGCGIPFDSPTFNEFVVQFPAGFENTYNRLLIRKIVAGLPLASHYPDMAGHYLLCVTETMSKADMDALIEEIQP